jgi:hypothetical protein
MVEWKPLPPLWPSPGKFADFGEFMLLVFVENGTPRWEVRRRPVTNRSDDLIASGNAVTFETAKSAALIQGRIARDRADGSTMPLPAHHSAVRSILAKAHGGDYAALESFDLARAHADAIVIMEGDEGGTIYLTVPIRKVSCGEVALNHLLSDIDAMCWAQLGTAQVFYEVLPIGGGVAGGMGGGRVGDGLWLHPKLERLSVRKEIEEVLQGQRERIEAAGKRW